MPQLIEVRNETQWEQFVSVTDKIYKNDPHFVNYLQVDIKKSLFKEGLKRGNCQMWVLLSPEGPIGRIAAFTNKEGAGIGFFECIDDLEAASRLFEVAESWLESEGFDTFQAPVNYGERDKYWGLLIENRGQHSFQENYHPPYYQSFFDQLGYTKAFDQITYYISADTPKMDGLFSVYHRLKSGNHWRFESFNPSKTDAIVKDFCKIYNEAWAAHPHFDPMQETRVLDLLKQIKALLIPRFFKMAYYDGEAVGFFLALPDANQWLKGFNGRMGLWNKLLFWWRMKTSKITSLRGIVFGVMPEYQGKGASVGLIASMLEEIKKEPMVDGMELAWIGDFNVEMNRFIKNFEPRILKVHRTFRKEIKKK